MSRFRARGSHSDARAAAKPTTELTRIGTANPMWTVDDHECKSLIVRNRHIGRTRGDSPSALDTKDVLFPNSGSCPLFSA